MFLTFAFGMVLHNLIRLCYTILKELFNIMESAVSAPSPAFFSEHHSVFDRIEMLSAFSECVDLLDTLSVEAFADDDVKQYCSLHELSFYLDTICSSLVVTLKSKEK